MNQQDLYKQIIMSHYNNPQNRSEKAPEGYICKKGINPSCGDELEVYIKLNGEVVEDIKFNGEGCSICCSSASVMTQEVIGQNKEVVNDKVFNFEKMLKGQEFNKELFEDAIAYEGLVKFPARFKCAFLSWKTVQDILLIER